MVSRTGSDKQYNEINVLLSSYVFLFVLPRQVFKHATVGVNHDGLVVLHRLVVAALGESCCVVEVAGGDTLANVGRLPGVGHNLNFNTVQESFQLIPDVAGPLHGTGKVKRRDVKVFVKKFLKAMPPFLNAPISL